MIAASATKGRSIIMNPGLSSFTIEDVKLPMKFILTGVLLFVTSQGLLIEAISPLVQNTPQLPSVWAAVHLLILGFAVMVAMGAMYQLVPVALQTSIYSLRLGHLQFVIYTVGTLGMAWGFYDFSSTRLLISSVIAVLGIILFEINMWLSIKGAKNTEISEALKLSLLYFLLTITLGLWLAIDFYHPHMGVWHKRIVFIHIILGTIGWFTLLIVGFSYKLIPMFTLSHGYESKLTRYSVRFINAGILLSVLGIPGDWDFILWAGIIIILIGFILFIGQIQAILQKRLRKKLDLGLQVSLLAWPFTLILVLMTGSISLLLTKSIHPSSVFYVIIMGWISLSILGYLYKIVPFLWWTYRYSEKIGQHKVPSLKEIMNEGRGQWIFLAIIAGITINTFAILFGLNEMMFVVQLVVFGASIFYAIETFLVFRK
jgi:hypothetical protein